MRSHSPTWRNVPPFRSTERSAHSIRFLRFIHRRPLSLHEPYRSDAHQHALRKRNLLRKRKAGRTSSFGNSAGLNARRPFEAEKRIAALLIKAVRVRRSCASGIAFNISFQSVSSAISGKRTGKYQREQKRYASGKGNKNKASGIVTTCLVSGGVAPSKSELSADAISSSEIVCVPC